MAMTEKKFFFRLQLSQQQFLRYYQGGANSVRVMSENGQTLQFPAYRLRSFLTPHGISGRFVLVVDQNNRFIRMEKLG